MTAALTGRADARGPMRPRTLACTADGIWLWPGTPLTEKHGGALVPIPVPQLYQHVATLHGPAVHAAALARVIERAAACLNRGRREEADQVLAAVPLPPVSFDGAALMQAIGRRLGVSVPDVEIAGWPSASPSELFEQPARVHDHKLAVASPSSRSSTPTFSASHPPTFPSIRWSTRDGLLGGPMAASSAARRQPDRSCPMARTGDTSRGQIVGSPLAPASACAEAARARSSSAAL